MGEEREVLPEWKVWLDRLETGMICVSAQHEVLYFNPFVARSLGITPSRVLEELGKPVLELLSPASPGVLQPVLDHREPECVCTLQRYRGPFRVMLRRLTPPPGWSLGGYWLAFYPLGQGASKEGAFSIIAFYSLLMHELKNPLAAVKMLVQGLQLELPRHTLSLETTRALEPYLERANREIDRVVKRMDSVKYLSKLTLERHERYDLTAVARTLVHHLHPVLERQQVHCQLQLDPAGAYLEGDPDELRQVLLNLIDFALDAMAERGGLLRLSIKQSPGEVRLQLVDTGAGMSEDELTALQAQHDPFRSGSLGLSVARWIIERHHGQIQFVSQKGRGTSVEVRLPSEQAIRQADERGR